MAPYVRAPAVAGAYVTRIAFYAWQGRTGFSYEDIPDD